MQFLKRLIYGTRYARVSNDASERIETLRFVVPALRVGVLEYAPGQLQTGASELQNKTVKLYYPPEALKDKKFLKSLEDAPIVLGGHDKTTNEKDKEIDGWARSVRYDEAQQAAIVDGTTKGKDNAKYIRDNFKTDGFGASAFIDVYGLKIEEGVTPDGEQYNAVATKLRAVHLALAPSVRDPENQIEIVNAVTINSHGTMSKEVEVENMREVEVTYSNGDKMVTSMASGLSDNDIKNYYKIGKKFNIGSGSHDKIVEVRSVKILNTEEKMEIDEKSLGAIVANSVKEALAKNAEGEELDDMKATLAKLVEAVEILKKAVGSETEERKTDEGEAMNEDDKNKKDEEDEKDGATLGNAVPSQKIVSAFASAFNIEFGRKTPSFATLANLAGIKETDACARIAAVNAKYAEFSESTAMNMASGSKTSASVFGMVGGDE